MNIQLNVDAINAYFQLLHSQIDGTFGPSIMFMDLGVKMVRILCYSETAEALIDREFSYVLRPDADHYDETIIVWGIADIGAFSRSVMSCFEPRTKVQMQAEMLWIKSKYPRMYMTSNLGSSYCYVDGHQGVVEAYDAVTHTAFCAYESYSPEAFVKHGHALVRMINTLVKTEISNLVHGAVFGYNGNGFLLCGRGKRGKSTLTVDALLSGFEFLSDDYQIIVKRGDKLLAYPIYSIITLSPRMYNEMYDRFSGKFLCNNFTNDKYLFNISCYHDRFQSAYPIRFCLFPEIVSDAEPSIRICSKDEKGRAIVQLILSTLNQMGDLREKDTIGKLYGMVRNLAFYKFNLCSDIRKNTEFLRAFLREEKDFGPEQELDESIVMDITFGLATIIDLGKGIVYDMDKFTTNILSLVLSGKSSEEIRNYLIRFVDNNPDILTEFDRFLDIIEEKGFNKLSVANYPDPDFIPRYAEQSDYKLSVIDKSSENGVDLIRYECK